jgi:polyisoprenoid-binding protein YceI
MRNKMKTTLATIVTAILLWCTSQVVWAASYSVDKSKSIFGIIIHKGGYAAVLAHNHFVFAQDYEATLSFDPRNLPNSYLTLSMPVTGLVNDEPTVSAAWSPRIRALNILSESLPTVSAEDRNKIFKDMMSPGQLDAARYPTIHLAVSNLEKKDSLVGEETFEYQIKVALTVHGQTVEKRFPANVHVVGNTLQAESVGTFSFTDFGIAPFSSFMGAFTNQDEFHAYVKVVANALE